MAYLAVLALAGVQVLSTTVGAWHSDLNGNLTVQIPAAETTEDDQANVATVMDVLLDTVNVSHAEVVSEDRVVALLEPWLGDIDIARELPLPQLIDVNVRQGPAA